MFEQLSENELYECEGGVWPLIVKIGVGVIVTVFAAGTVRGCTQEAANYNSPTPVPTPTPTPIH